MEEEEIAGLREQRRQFQERRKHEETLLKQLQDEQRRISEEKVGHNISQYFAKLRNYPIFGVGPTKTGAKPEWGRCHQSK